MSDDDLSYLARLREQGQIGDEEYAAYAQELARGGTLPTDLRHLEQSEGEPGGSGSAPAEPAAGPGGLPELRIFRFPGGGPPGAGAPEEPAPADTTQADDGPDDSPDIDHEDHGSGLDDYEPISSWEYDESTRATTYTPDLADLRGPAAEAPDLTAGPPTPPPSRVESGAESDRGIGAAPYSPQTPPPYPAVTPQTYAGQPAAGQPAPAQPGGAGLPPRGGSPAEPTKTGGSRKLPLIIGAAVLLIAVAVAAWIVIPGGGPSQSAVDESQGETGKDPAATEPPAGQTQTSGQSDEAPAEGWAATSCAAVTAWDEAAAPLADRIADAAAQEAPDATDQLVAAYQTLLGTVANLDQAVSTPAPDVDGAESAAERLIQAVADVKRQLDVGISEAQNSLPPGSPFGTKANELLQALDDLSDDPQTELKELIQNAPAELRALFSEAPQCSPYVGGR